MASRSSLRECSLHDVEEFSGRNWFAVYTTCRHEKRVAWHFERRGIEFFLPVYRAQHRWKDGSKASLDLPLFPGYIFAHIRRSDRINVLQVPGVVSVFGTSSSQPTPLPEFEMEALRKGLDPVRTEPHRFLNTGQEVRIRSGALAGMEGIVIRKRNSFRVVLTLELLMQSIAVEVNGEDLEPLGPNTP
jgi:transcription antitermination factor NusG